MPEEQTMEPIAEVLAEPIEESTLEPILDSEILDSEMLEPKKKPKEVEDPKWYVVHTYSGYENKVKANVEKAIENRGMQELIDQVVVPTQETVEIKNGVKKRVQRKIYPGYVLVKMSMTDETWFVVRNTTGVTSFVGPASKPIPLTDEEIISMGIEMPDIELDISPDQLVRIIAGPFDGSVGNVKEVNAQKKTVTVSLSVFGRETQVELDYHIVQRM